MLSKPGSTTILILTISILWSSALHAQVPPAQASAEGEKMETGAESETAPLETTMPEPEPEPEPAEPATEAAEGALDEELVVYGEKRRIVSATRMDTQLMDIPMAVQVLDEELLEQQMILDLREVFRNVSGIQNTAAWGNGSAALGISARGFDLANTNFRRNGLYMANVGNHYSPAIQEVQILKGPASVLYGDVAPGGVVNLVTKKPVLGTFQDLELTTGEEGLFRPVLDVNGMVNGNDRFLYRVVATYEESDSYRDVVGNSYTMIAPSFTWRVNARTELTLEGMYRDDESTEDTGIKVPSGSLEEVESIPISRFYGHPIQGNTYEDTSFHATLTHFLNDRWELRVLSQYQDNPRLNRGVWQSTFIDEDTISYGNSATFDDYQNLTGVFEVVGRVQTGSVTHRILFGADHTRATTRTAYERFPNSEGSFNDPDWQEMPNILDLSNDFYNYKLVERRTGINIQNNMSFLDERLHVLLGARINDFYRKNEYDNPADEPEDNLSDEDDPVNPRFGVVYKPRENVSIYGSYGESFEVNGRHRYNPNRFLDPTLGEQYEIGFKGNFFSDRLGTTVSLFNLEKQDFPSYIDVEVADANGIDYDHDEVSIDNDVLYVSKAQRARGVELDWNGRINNSLYLIGSATVLDTEILDDIIYEEGNRLENAPEFSASIWGQYRLNQSWFMGAGAFYQGDYYGDKANTEATRSPAHTKIDVSLGYQTRSLRIQLNVKNLTDEQTYLNKWGFWNPQWPRRALLQISYRL